MILIAAGLLVMSLVIVISIRRSSKKIAAINSEIKSGKSMEAIQNLQKLVAADDEDLLSRYQLAKLQLQANMVVPSLKNAKHLLNKNLTGSGVKHAAVLLLVAEAQMNLGNRKEAYRYLRMAHGVDSTNVEVNYNLAVFEYESGSYDEAFNYASRVIRMEPHHIDGNYYMGMAALQKGQLDQALQGLRKTLELKPDHFQANFSLGRVYAQRGNRQGARQYFKAALNRATNNDQRGQVYYYLGTIEKRSGDHQGAVKFLESALKLYSGSDLRLKIYSDLLDIYEEKKNIPMVIRTLRSILKEDPDDKAALSKLNHYRELNTNSMLQKYEVLPEEEFMQFCVEVAKTITKLDKIGSVERNMDGSFDLLASRSNKVEYVVFLFRFIRSGGDIGEMPVRDLYEKMRSNNAEKAVFVCNSQYTKSAQNFAQTRVVTLIDKPGLIKYLERMKG